MFLTYQIYKKNLYDEKLFLKTIIDQQKEHLRVYDSLISTATNDHLRILIKNRDTIQRLFAIRKTIVIGRINCFQSRLASLTA